MGAEVNLSARQFSRIGHLPGRSLDGKVLGHMVRDMFGRLVARRIATLVLAFGMFLNGAAPSWAVPAAAGRGSMHAGMAMMMPGMAVQNACAAMPNKGDINKHAPCKSADGNCVVCAACGLSFAVIQVTSPIRSLDSGDQPRFGHDASRNGIALLPALPPPIVLA